MKRLAIALCVVPVFALGQAHPWPQGAAETCYVGTGNKTEVMKALACLKANPEAGSVITNRLKQANAELLAGDADIAAEFNTVELQKNKRLYVKYRSADGVAKFMIVDAAIVGGSSPTVVYDLAALNIKFVHTSATSGSDNTVPLEEVRSFYYKAKSDIVGELTTALINETRIVDKSYRSSIFLKQDGPNGLWRGVTEFVGTSYPGKIADEHLSLSPQNLSGTVVTFLAEAEGRDLVAKLDIAISSQQRTKQEAERVAAEQRRIEAERKSKALAEMSRAPRGSEDSCRRVGAFAAVADSDFADIECQFGGKVNLNDLTSVGWLVVDKKKDGEGVVREYYIRKVR